MMNNILELMIRRSRQATPSVPSDYVFYAPLSSTSPLEDETGKELVYNGTMTAEVVDGIPCVFMPCESDINHSYLLTNDTTGISTGNQSITMSVWFKRYSLSQIGEWEVVFAAGYPSPYQVPLFGYHQGYVYYSTYSYDIFTTIPADLLWHHYALRYDSNTSTFSLFVDNELVKQTIAESKYNFPTGNKQIILNAQAIGNGDFPKGGGHYASAYIYDRALSDAEIGMLYNEHGNSSDVSDSSSSGSDISDSSSSGSDISDSSSSMSDSSSSISDLIFHAPFTTDLSDIAGNRTATPTDSGAADVTITTKDGKSCVYVPNNARLLYSPCGDVPLGNTSKSMSIWVNMDFTNSGWNGIFAVGENSRYKLFMLSTNNSWKVSYGGSWNDVYSTSQLHSGWNHMAVTYDTTAIKLYHDGVLVHTSQQSDKVDTAETNICVGGRPAASDNYCESAWFSDARIYSRALTDAEILSIYQEGL